MKLIIPMAGMGTRMRPHTLNVPKPLLKIAGVSIIDRIVNDLISYTGKNIEEIHFVIGDFGIAIEKKLLSIAENKGIKGFIHYQKEALGTAHAVYCANSALSGEVLISFADTIFIGNLLIEEQEAIVWTKEVEHPENYGIAVCDSKGIIKSFKEKPKEFISNNAIIGIYYFKRAELLSDNIKLLIKEEKKRNGEYQLTDSLINLLNEKVSFSCKTIDHWLDCGSKNEFLNSNMFLLERQKSIIKSDIEKNVTIVDPVYIGENVKLINTKIGPYASIDKGSEILNGSIRNSIIGCNASIKNSTIDYSIIGDFSKINGLNGILNIGDYCEYEKI